MSINILGTEYSLKIVEERDEVMQEDGLQGYCNTTTKEIAVLADNVKHLTLRHEVIHAFLFESGIQCGTLFHSEEMVDWLAVQIPKIMNLLDSI